MAVNLSPVGGVAGQFFDNNGNPLTGGKIFTYSSGTTTNQATYISSAGVTAHTNPIILDAAGRVPGGEIWLTDGLQYKFVIKTANDVLIGTYDNIIGINSNFVNFLTETEVQTATAGQTVFTLTTMQYQPGTNNLTVYVDGVNQIDGSTYSYTETDATTVTFTAGLHVGALVKFTTAQTLSTGVTDASLVTYNPPFTAFVPTTVEDKLAQTISVMDFGAVGDGVADDTAAIQAAIVAANDVAFVYFPAGTYKVTGTIEMPLKVSGNFTISGNIKWSFKKEIVQEGEVFATGSILLDSVWYSNFNYIKAGTTITLQSSNATWGVFWNKFENVICAGTLVINVDQGQSVNQNVFVNCICSGGLQIAGTNVSGIREAHNNLFISIDTTGANLTAIDGTTGVHILNDSNLNQTNAVQNWYAENTGSRIIKGNWDVLGSNVDANNQNVMIGRSNSYLNARALSRNGSFVSQIVNNLANGGDWGSLGDTGFPLSLSGTSATLALVTDCPDGGRLTMKVTGGVTFRSHEISYRLTTSGRVTATAYVYQEGTPSTSVEIYNNLGTLIAAGVGSYTAIGGFWYLLRIAGESAVLNEAGGITTGTIKIYTTTSSALTSADFRQVASYIVTTDSYCPLPSREIGYPTVYSTAAPTSGFYEAGTVCLNTAPSAGGTPGWVCTTGGSTGTFVFKAMANLAA